VSVPAEESASQNVRSVERAVELLFRLAEHQRGASLQQLAGEVGWGKSTVHRLLGTLERLAVVERDPSGRVYQLGPRVAQLGAARRRAADLVSTARPFLQALRAQTGETVSLHGLTDDSHVVLDQLESHHEIRRVLAVGQPIPLLRGATARAILAFLSDDEANQILKRTRETDEPGPSTGELRKIKQRGYALSLGERIAGGLAMSAPLLDADGRVLGAVSVSGPSFRFTAEQAESCAPALLKAVNGIAAALG
jgi:DNA-binding IclR family transcriptional regulator